MPRCRTLKQVRYLHTVASPQTIVAVPSLPPNLPPGKPCEALGSVRTLEHFAFLMVVLALLMLTVLLAYFWTHREQELADLEVLEIQRPSQGKASA